MNGFRRILSASALLLGAGCASDETLRLEGVTPGAGEAAAANTAMQIVDPRSFTAGDTRLLVPAVRPGPRSTSDASVTGASSQAPGG